MVRMNVEYPSLDESVRLTEFRDLPIKGWMSLLSSFFIFLSFYVIVG